MADAAKDSTGLTYIRFWIRSNRGTNESARKLVALVCEGKDQEAEIKDWLEDWCSQFGAWSHGDNRVSYGYEVLGVNVQLKTTEAPI